MRIALPRSLVPISTRITPRWNFIHPALRDIAALIPSAARRIIVAILRPRFPQTVTLNRPAGRSNARNPPEKFIFSQLTVIDRRGKSCICVCVCVAKEPASLRWKSQMAKRAPAKLRH